MIVVKSVGLLSVLVSVLFGVKIVVNDVIFAVPATVLAFEATSTTN